MHERSHHIHIRPSFGAISAKRPRFSTRHIVLIGIFALVVFANTRSELALYDGTASLVPNVSPFFGCSSNESICKDFVPKHFFKVYVADQVLRNEADHENVSPEQTLKDWRNFVGLENSNLPALDSIWWTTKVGRASAVNFPRNITFVHDHKCGGTSVQSTLYRRARSLRQQEGLDASVDTFKHSFGGGSKEKKLTWDMQRMAHIKAISKLQDSGDHSSHPVFSTLRCPVERFLSAIQQVMQYNSDFKSKCLHGNKFFSSSASEAVSRQRTIQCSILDIKETAFRRDVHLIPMASHFRLMDDIRISMFELNDIEELLQYLGGERSNVKSSTIHARDKSKARSTILAKLSVDDCTQDMVAEICSLYGVDVALMNYLGFRNSTRCM